MGNLCCGYCANSGCLSCLPFWPPSYPCLPHPLGLTSPGLHMSLQQVRSMAYQLVTPQTRPLLLAVYGVNVPVDVSSRLGAVPAIGAGESGFLADNTSTGMQVSTDSRTLTCLTIRPMETATHVRASHRFGRVDGCEPCDDWSVAESSPEKPPCELADGPFTSSRFVPSQR